jgi:hypothetical protein
LPFQTWLHAFNTPIHDAVMATKVDSPTPANHQNHNRPFESGIYLCLATSENGKTKV